MFLNDLTSRQNLACKPSHKLP